MLSGVDGHLQCEIIVKCQLCCGVDDICAMVRLSIVIEQ